MKVATITPWAIKCGIYTYSRDLTYALADKGVDSYIIRLPRFGLKNVDILMNVVDSIPLDKVDLVHVQHEYGLYQGLEGNFYNFLRKLGKPIVTTMHAVGSWNLDRTISSFSDQVITHNRFCSKNFRFPSTIIPHGCKSVECPAADEAKVKFDIPPEAPIVGYCGFISSNKGVENLIDAMIEVKGAALLIGGGWHTGQDTSYIINLKKRSLEVLKGRCQWLGYVPEEDLPEVYGSMSLFVYPSRFATESGALLTALGHGKAVLASSIPPFAEKEEEGALMTFSDVDDLIKKIKWLIDDDEMRLGFEEGARNYVEENSWANVAGRHIELYRQVLEARRSEVS